MSHFKKFFSNISAFGKRIYNSRGFEIAAFVLETVNKTVDWAKLTSEFIDQMKLVAASFAIVGKFILKGIVGFGKKISTKVNNVTAE